MNKYIIRNKASLLFTLIFLGVFCLSFRFFINFRYESLGHNWDWGFPALQFLFRKIINLSLYSWNEFNLGKEFNLQAHLIPNAIVSGLAYVLQVKDAIFFILASVVAISFVSFKKFLDLIVKKSSLNYIPSLLYAFSPFLFNEITGGSWYMWISYAFAPILFSNLVKFIKLKSRKSLLLFGLSAIFVISSLQNFVLIEVIIILYLINQVLLEKADLKLLVSRYFSAHFFLTIINLYWILPFIYGAKSFYSVVSSTSFNGNFESVNKSTQNLLSIFSLVGYLDRNLYYHGLFPWVIPLFTVVFSAFWLLVLVSLFLKNKDSVYRSLVWWIFSFVVLIFFIKGGNAPFSQETMLIFRNFSFMSLYRSPQHLMFAAAILIPLIMSLSIHRLFKVVSNKKLVLFFYLFIVILWIMGWWINGDIGHDILKQEKRDYVDFYSLSENLKEVYKTSESDNLNHRLLFLPTSYSPDFIQNNYQNKAQGGQPEYNYLDQPTFSSDLNSIANIIDSKFCDKTKLNLTNYLSIFNVKYLSLREDIYPHHTRCGTEKSWDIHDVEKYINSDNRLQEIGQGLYRVNNDYFLPMVYIPTMLISSNGNQETVARLVSDVTYRIGTGIYLTNQDNGNIGSLINLNEGINRPSVEYTKINPTKYIIKINKTQDTFPLVLSQNFHSGWKLYLMNKNENKNNEFFFETWFEKPVAEDGHFIINGYANSWILNPEKICNKNHWCSKNADGTYDFELVIEFFPQRLFYLGAFLSGTIVIIFSSYSMFFLKDKFENRSVKKDKM